MRVLGVDYGERKVGLALGDTDLRVASPLEVWSHGGDREALVARLLAFAAEEDVGIVVLGVPVKQDGSDTEQGARHREFANLLEATGEFPVVIVNEAFTSKEGQRLQQEYGLRAEEDALAAMLIIQEYFEHAS